MHIFSEEDDDAHKHKPETSTSLQKLGWFGRQVLVALEVVISYSSLCPTACALMRQVIQDGSGSRTIQPFKTRPSERLE